MRPLIIALMLVGLSACQQRGPRPSRDVDSGKLIGAISVPADPAHTYLFVRSSKRADGSFDVVTRMDAKWGVVSERREIDCAQGRFRYRGHGDIIEHAAGPQPPEPYERLSDDPIASAIAAYVCAPEQRAAPTASSNTAPARPVARPVPLKPRAS